MFKKVAVWLSRLGNLLWRGAQLESPRPDIMCKDKIVDDSVEKIENHKEYSLAYTKSGNGYKAQHVVIAIGLRRKVFRNLLDFDYNSLNVIFGRNMGPNAPLRTPRTDSYRLL